MSFLTAQNHKVEYTLLQSATPVVQTPTIVMLHEGLGSIAMWKNFPQQVSDATGCEVLVYSRYGYGNSDPIEKDHDVDYQHIEALESLPDLLDQLEINKPILFGHSDGASIALIHAGGSNRELSGVIVMAPHVMVEDVSISGIMATKEAYLNTNFRDKLAKYHSNVDSAFFGWCNIWLHPEFLNWNIEQYLPSISCPVLAIQGIDDEYGTMEHLEIIKRKTNNVELLKLTRCGHSPHKDHPDLVIKTVTDFINRIRVRYKQSINRTCEGVRKRRCHSKC